jgi:hypothetical protein
VQPLLLRLWSASKVKIDKLTRTRLDAHGKPLEEVQLDLRSGKVIVVNQKVPASSLKYEIRVRDWVVRVRDGAYELTAEGRIRVTKGMAEVVRLGGGVANEITSGHAFDCFTGETFSCDDVGTLGLAIPAL